MKTPLPKKITGPDTVGLGYWASEVNAMAIDELQKSHNQLIDVVAELMEERVYHNEQPEKRNITTGEIVDRVSKGIQERQPNIVFTSTGVPMSVNGKTVQNLKEQLLGEIQAVFLQPSTEAVRIEKIEAIINKLMP